MTSNFLDNTCTKIQNMDQIALEYWYYGFLGGLRFDGRGFLHQTPILKNSSPEQKSICRTCAEACHSPLKGNNNSRHGKFHRFLFPFSSKFPDLNFARYVLYIYWCCMKPVRDTYSEPGSPVVVSPCLLSDIRGKGQIFSVKCTA